MINLAVSLSIRRIISMNIHYVYIYTHTQISAMVCVPVDTPRVVQIQKNRHSWYLYHVFLVFAVTDLSYFMPTSSFKSTNRGELLNYVSHTSKWALRRFSKLTHTFTNSHTRANRPRMPGMVKKGDVHSLRKTCGAGQGCFSNAPRDHEESRATHSGWCWESVPEPFGCPLLSTEYSTAGQTCVLMYNTEREGYGAADCNNYIAPTCFYRSPKRTNCSTERVSSLLL